MSEQPTVGITITAVNRSQEAFNQVVRDAATLRSEIERGRAEMRTGIVTPETMERMRDARTELREQVRVQRDLRSAFRLQHEAIFTTAQAMNRVANIGRDLTRLYTAWGVAALNVKEAERQLQEAIASGDTKRRAAAEQAVAEARQRERETQISGVTSLAGLPFDILQTLALLRMAGGFRGLFGGLGTALRGLGGIGRAALVGGAAAGLGAGTAAALGALPLDFAAQQQAAREAAARGGQPIVTRGGQVIGVTGQEPVLIAALRAIAAAFTPRPETEGPSREPGRPISPLAQAIQEHPFTALYRFLGLLPRPERPSVAEPRFDGGLRPSRTILIQNVTIHSTGDARQVAREFLDALDREANYGAP